MGGDDDGRDGGCDYAYVAAQADAGEHVIVVRREFPQQLRVCLRGVRLCVRLRRWRTLGILDF